MVGAALHTILSGVVHVYPLRAAQGTKPPLATYQVTNVNPVKTMAGVNNVFEYDIQLNIHATTYDAADTLAHSVITTIDRYSAANLQNENIRDIRHEGGPDDLFQNDANLYGKAIDIKIWITHN